MNSRLAGLGMESLREGVLRGVYNAIIPTLGSPKLPKDP